MDEIAAKQRQREQEAEERRAREKAEREAARSHTIPERAAPAAPAASAAESEASIVPPPRWRNQAGAGEKMGWREREALKKANGELPVSSTPPPPENKPYRRPEIDRTSSPAPATPSPPSGAIEAPKPGKYLPPSRRVGGGPPAEPSTSSTPPPPAEKAATEAASTGKYRPGAFSSNRGKGSGGERGMGMGRTDRDSAQK